MLCGVSVAVVGAAILFGIYKLIMILIETNDEKERENES